MKEKLLAICIAQQEEIAQTAQNLMNEAQTMANEYGAPKDRYDSFRTKQMRLADMYSKQFDNAQNMLRILHQIDPTVKHKSVEFGSLVTTDQQKMFISVSMGKIEVEGEVVYAISVHVPIFEAMKGKTARSSFTFQGRTQKILSIN